MTGPSLEPLRLKRHQERRLRAGHLWVFSNEVDTAATPLTAFEPGQLVEVQDAAARPLGTAYVNPRSLICARLVSRHRDRPFSEALIGRRIALALALRERLYDEPYYRLVHGEGDGLPGLVVDRYGEVLVVQFNTAGMERMRDVVLAALNDQLNPAGVLLRNDSPVRTLEGLGLYTQTAVGEVPERVLVREQGLAFQVALGAGQKTGWFFDQRDNRLYLPRFVAGRRVLDVFSYVGAWGVRAAACGAAQALCVDESAPALELAARNAECNGVGERVATLRGEAFQTLRDLLAGGERFDVVILDPPAFIKRRKDLKSGVTAYRRLNEQAMRLLTRDAVLISCSCSYLLTQQDLLRQILAAARREDRELEVLGFGHQGPDHPVHPAIPETAYLKAVFARVLR
jgi:23S rRNA (cytosine1962-C5)-methyltransferase